MSAVEDLLRAELTEDEGKKLCAYDDASGRPLVKGMTLAGNPSIGIGRDLASDGISEEECELLFANDMQSAQAEVLGALPWVADLSPARQVVVFSLHFNMCLHNIHHLSVEWPKFLAQMQAGDFGTAATNLESSQPWAREVGPRAARLANLVRNG
jgi:lysozyme